MFPFIHILEFKNEGRIDGLYYACVTWIVDPLILLANHYIGSKIDIIVAVVISTIPERTIFMLDS